MKKLLLISLLSFFIFIFYGQDAHYWTEQYGTRSMLLSNSITGSVQDLGAVFYNPARLPMIEDNAFIISGKVYEFMTYSYKNTGEGDYKSSERKSEFNSAPSLLAGSIKFKKLENHFFAYSFLGRTKMNIELEDGYSADGDVLDQLLGEEDFSAYVNQRKRISEEWMGFSWAYSVRPEFSVGVSTFLSVRKQNTGDQLELQAYFPNNTAMYNNFNGYRYSHTGLIWKFGAAWERGPLSWGVTITTPTLSISGEGSFNYNQFYTGIEEQYHTGSNDIDPLYEQYNQSKLDVIYKSPLSVAAGIGLNYKWGNIHVSAEYFSKVKKYNLMTGPSANARSTSEVVLQANLVDELNPVLNFGVGCNFKVNDQINGYVSYSTDFSAAKGDIPGNQGFKSDYNASVFNSDIHHLAGGVLMNFRRGTSITLGTTLALTDFGINSPIGFPRTQREELNTDLNWKRWRFIIGISIPSIDALRKKVENKLKEIQEEEYSDED